MAAVVRHRAQRRRSGPASAPWSFAENAVGTSGVPRPVPSSLASKPSPAECGPRMFRSRQSIRPLPPFALQACYSIGPVVLFPPNTSNRSIPDRDVVAPATSSPKCRESPPEGRLSAANRIREFFPRFAARRSIPAQAFALKKYRRGTAPVSKMSDNEDATASLGHSEELSVQDSPGATIPEFRQRPEDGAKVPSAVRGQDTGDVFPDDPPRPQSASKPAKLDGQVATRVIQAASSSGDREGLAGSSSGQNVDWTADVLDRREVAKVLNVGVAMRQQRRTERIDLSEPGGPEAQRLPGDGHGLDARTNAAVDHVGFLRPSAPDAGVTTADHLP